MREEKSIFKATLVRGEANSALRWSKGGFFWKSTLQQVELRLHWTHAKFPGYIASPYVLHVLVILSEYSLSQSRHSAYGTDIIWYIYHVQFSLVVNLSILIGTPSQSRSNKILVLFAGLILLFMVRHSNYWPTSFSLVTDGLVTRRLDCLLKEDFGTKLVDRYSLAISKVSSKNEHFERLNLLW